MTEEIEKVNIEEQEPQKENLEDPKGKSELDTLKEENIKIKETLMRTLAELDNTRKRALDENDKIKKFAVGKFAEDLLNVMENFYLAFDSIDESQIDKNFLDGIKMTHNELKKVFEKNNLIRIYPLNEEFNPSLHNAITQIESELEDGKIAQVMQAGYLLNDRVLRPALVAVSKKNQ
jgi:molecular chaperone GrpE